MASHNIVTLPGDGIGPEILGSATRVLDAVGSFTYDERSVRWRVDRRPRHAAHR